MQEVKIVGRGVDTLVINVCYANEHFQPVKQELAKGAGPLKSCSIRSQESSS